MKKQQYNSAMRCIVKSAAALVVLMMFPLLAAAQSQTAEDAVHSFVDQKLILRSLGDQKHTEVKRKDLAHLNGGCDVVVQIKEATWNQRKILFRWLNIGSPYLPGQPRGNCKTYVDSSEENTLEISGFTTKETPDSIASSVGQLLQTPEQYLTAKGVPFNLPSTAPDSDQDGANKTPLRIAQGVTPPKAVLQVDPVYSEDARQAKLQGAVMLWLIIGTDGRIHNAKIARNLGLGLSESAMNVLSLWRFEPARKDEKPVPVQVNVEVNFHLY